MLRVLGPAWVVMLADVDAASVLTAAKAGTDFGFAMLLPLAVLIPVLYLVQEMTARLAIGTGLGHAELIRARYGVRWASVAVVSMVLIDLLAYVAEFAGIVLGASLIGVGAVPAVVGALAFHSVMVFTRSYRVFERITIALSLSLFAFVGLAFVAGPDPGSVLGGLSPVQPFDRPGYLDLVVATIGAVVMPWMLFYQQAATVDKRLGPADLRGARWETLIGAIASELLMAAIVIAAAAATAAHDGSTVAGGLSLPAGLAALAAGPAGILVAVGMIGAPEQVLHRRRQVLGPLRQIVAERVADLLETLRQRQEPVEDLLRPQALRVLDLGDETARRGRAHVRVEVLALFRGVALAVDRDHVTDRRELADGGGSGEARRVAMAGAWKMAAVARIGSAWVAHALAVARGGPAALCARISLGGVLRSRGRHEASPDGRW